MQFWAPDDGRKKRPKHVERLTEINKLRKFASCWLYSANILAMHGPMNVKKVTENYSTPAFYSGLVPCKQPYMAPAWLFPCLANRYFAGQNIHHLLWTPKFCCNSTLPKSEVQNKASWNASTVIPRLTSDPANEDFFAVFWTRLTNMYSVNECFSGCMR